MWTKPKTMFKMHSQNLDQAKQEYAKEMEGYGEAMQKAINNNKAMILEMRAQKINERAEEIRERNERIDALQKRNDEMEIRMQEIEEYQQGKIGKPLNGEFKNDMDELGQAFRDMGKNKREVISITSNRQKS